MRIQLRTGFITAIFILLNACGSTVEKDSAPKGSTDVSKIPNAIPKHEPRSKYGNPSSYVVFGKRYYVLDSGEGFVERGIASWYGKKFHGRRTSSGETYDMFAMTAAHKQLPLPSYVEVTNLENNRSIIVKVNDRGPFHDNRVIDLSYTAALKLDIVSKGTGLVEVRTINPDRPKQRTNPLQTVSSKQPAPAQTVSGNQHRMPSFYIQVGAFSQLGNAENLRRKLTGIEEDLVNINQTVIDGTVLHRVHIGPLAAVAKADQIVNRLAELGVTDHTILIGQP